MANPLSWFRKHQKVMLVFFGVILMAVFGLGSVFTSLMPSGNSFSQQEKEKANRVIAKWNGGEYKRVDLDRYRRLHDASVRLVSGVDTLRRQTQGENATRDVDLIQPISAVLQKDIDEQLVFRLLAAERAKEMGIVVTEQMVTDYLNKVAPSPMSKFELEGINSEMNQDRTPLKFVKEHLKIELLAQQFFNLYSAEVMLPSATEAFDYYKKLNERIECQIATFKTEDYLEQVTENPTESELKALFEEGKFKYPDSFNVEPGFKQYPKIKLDFFLAKREVFIENEMRKLKPEEVVKEYERLVSMKDPLVIEELPQDGSTPGDSELSLPDGGDPKPADEENKPKPPSDVDKTENNKADDQKKDTTNKKSDNSSKDENQKSDLDKNKSDDKTSSDKTSSDKTSSDKTSSDKTSSDKTSSDKTSSDKTSSDKTSSDKTSSDKKSADKKKDDFATPLSIQSEVFTSLGEAENRNLRQDDQKTDDQKTDDQKTDDQKTQNKPDDQTKPGNDTTPPVLPTGDTPQENTTAGTQDEKPKTRTKRFDEVEDAIKRSLVTAIANEKLEKAFADAQDELLGYRAGYDYYRQTEKKEDKPIPVDFESLADDLKLEYGTTDFMDQTNYQSNRIGKIGQLRQTGQSFAFVPVGEEIFSNFEGISLYQPFQVAEFGSDPYLFWATEKVEAEVLQFQDARDQVVAFWKMKKAQELAKAAAQEFAARVNSEKRPMLEVNPDEAIPTGAFTWFSTTQGQFGGQPNVEYTRVPGTKSIGDTFMKTAFALPKLETGETRNETNDEFYAVQLIQRAEVQSSEEQITEYLDSIDRQKQVLPEVNLVSNLYYRQYLDEFRDEFMKSMGLEWLVY